MSELVPVGQDLKPITISFKIEGQKHYKRVDCNFWPGSKCFVRQSEVKPTKRHKQYLPAVGQTVKILLKRPQLLAPVFQMPDSLTHRITATIVPDKFMNTTVVVSPRIWQTLQQEALLPSHQETRAPRERTPSSSSSSSTNSRASSPSPSTPPLASTSLLPSSSTLYPAILLTPPPSPALLPLTVRCDVATSDGVLTRHWRDPENAAHKSLAAPGRSTTEDCTPYAAWMFVLAFVLVSALSQGFLFFLSLLAFLAFLCWSLPFKRRGMAADSGEQTIYYLAVATET